MKKRSSIRAYVVAKIQYKTVLVAYPSLSLVMSTTDILSKGLALSWDKNAARMAALVCTGLFIFLLFMPEILLTATQLITTITNSKGNFQCFLQAHAF